MTREEAVEQLLLGRESQEHPLEYRAAYFEAALVLDFVQKIDGLYANRPSSTLYVEPDGTGGQRFYEFEEGQFLRSWHMTIFGSNLRR